MGVGVELCLGASGKLGRTFAYKEGSHGMSQGGYGRGQAVTVPLRLLQARRKGTGAALS